MTHVQHSASLHEKAVQAVASGEAHIPTRRRSEAVRKAYRGRYVHVHPAVMDAARKSLGIGQRIVIVSETEVRIVNR